MNPTPCTPSMSAFRWRCTDGLVAFSPDDRHWYSVGEPSDLDGPFSRVYDKAFEPGPLTWKVFDHFDSDMLGMPSVVVWQDRVKDDNLRAELRLLSLVGAAIGCRLDAQRWRMLSPNAVLHPMFGPAVTVATDGSRVVLFAFPRFGTDYIMAHRTNIIGPVTSSAVHIADWDYSRNATAIAVGRAKAKTDKITNQKSLALELLNSLLVKQSNQQMQTNKNESI